MLLYDGSNEYVYVLSELVSELAGRVNGCLLYKGRGLSY